MTQTFSCRHPRKGSVVEWFPPKTFERVPGQGPKWPVGSAGRVSDVFDGLSRFGLGVPRGTPCSRRRQVARLESVLDPSQKSTTVVKPE